MTKEEMLFRANRMLSDCKIAILKKDRDEASVLLDRLERLLSFDCFTEDEKLEWCFNLLSLSEEIARL